MNRKTQLARFFFALTWPFHALGLLFVELDATSWIGFTAVVVGVLLMASAKFWILTTAVGLLCYFIGMPTALRLYEQKQSQAQPSFNDVFVVKILGNLIIGKLLYAGGLVLLELLRMLP